MLVSLNESNLGSDNVESKLNVTGAAQNPDKTVADTCNIEALNDTFIQQLLFSLLFIFSGGTFGLLAFWFPKVRLFFLFSSGQADTCRYISATFGDQSCDIIQVQQSTVAGKTSRWVEVRCQRFVFDTKTRSFQLLADIPQDFNHFLAGHAVADTTTRNEIELAYGCNRIDIPVPNWSSMFLLEAFQPFYVFQYASVIIWCVGEYWIYSIFIFVITMAAIILNVQQTHKNKVRLHELSSIDGFVVDMTSKSIPSSQLLPGDRFLVKTNQVLPCDAVLMVGECIVDESVLTGESMPVRKTGFRSGDDYNPTSHAQFTLFSGSKVKLAQGPSTANGSAVEVIACRTGFRSAKGQLIRAIMFPLEHELDYTKDALRFILFMAVFGVLFYIWSAVLLAQYGTPVGFICLKFFDMITIAVPPVLACALAIATSVAIIRLTNQNVFVSDNTRVNWAGLATAVCFDKTGTLTESGLAFHGIVVSKANSNGSNVVVNVDQLSDDLVEIMACCHSLSVLDGGLVGDPLELSIFEATAWTLSQVASPNGFQTLLTNKSNQTTKILRRFDFSSTKMRSGVVIQRPNNSTSFFVKGSPEIVKSIVNANSIPANFDQILSSFTKHGLRVIAIAAREVRSHEDFQLMDQEALENGLVYQGLILLENRLKSESKETVEVLLNADMKVVMITGDHVRTAISVAFGCSILISKKSVIILDASTKQSSMPYKFSIVDNESGADKDISQLEAESMIASGECELAVTGRALIAISEAYPDLTGFVLRYCKVFARMEPDDKRLIVEGLSHIPISSDDDGKNHYVAYCGDGANDIAALKSAMVGVSLCDAEASVAAPLTSRQQTPSIMPRILIEGRCSLVTSFVLFKFIMVYAFVQVFGTSLMYTSGLVVGNYQYLIQDLFYTSILAIAISLSTSSNTLSKERPPDRFMSYQMMIPVILQFVVVAAFQLASLGILEAEYWYSPYELPDGNSSALTETFSYENSAVFAMSLAQFMIAAVVLDVGAPFRQPWYRNKYVVFTLTYELIILLYVVLAGHDEVKEYFFEFKSFPVNFRFKLLALMVANLVVAYGFSHLSKWLLRRFRLM